jgi:hypothetical protein
MLQATGLAARLLKLGPKRSELLGCGGRGCFVVVVVVRIVARR